MNINNNIMKKVISIVLGLSVVIVEFFNFSIKDSEPSGSHNLINEALACQIVAESVNDYCWKLEFFPEYYTCEPDGMWSCVES